MANPTMNTGASWYSSSILGVYDKFVLGVSASYAWKCPTATVLLPFFRSHVSRDHMDVGVGTGYFLRAALASPDLEPSNGSETEPLYQDEPATPGHPFVRSQQPGGEDAQQTQQQLSLVDLNPRALAFAESRVLEANPDVAVRSVVADALEPLPEPLAGRKFTSISAFLLMHCIPCTPERKNALFQVLKKHLTDDGVLFGATVLGKVDKVGKGHTAVWGTQRGGEYQGKQLNWFGYLLMTLYNKLGVFHNWDDNQASIDEGLNAQFDEVETYIIGRVLLFRASKPKKD